MKMDWELFVAIAGLASFCVMALSALTIVMMVVWTAEPHSFRVAITIFIISGLALILLSQIQRNFFP